MIFLNSCWAAKASSSDLSTAGNGSFYYDSSTSVLYLTEVDSLGRDFSTFASDNDGTVLSKGGAWSHGIYVTTAGSLFEELLYESPTSWTLTKGINSFSLTPGGWTSANNTRFNNARIFSFDFASGPIESDGTTTWDLSDLPDAGISLTSDYDDIESGAAVKIYPAALTTVINDDTVAVAGPARGDYGQLYPRC